MGVSNNSYGDYGPLPESLSVMPEFPMPTEEELAAVNDLFEPYVFYKTVKDGRLLTTSCCGKKSVLYPTVRRTETPENREFLAAKHNDEVRCPFCGRPAELRCAGIRRDSLAEWQPVLFLREMDGDILALGVWARKIYSDTTRLWKGPEYHIVSAYRFSPGRAVQYENYWGNMKKQVLEGEYDPQHLKIRDPFTDGGYMGGSVYIPYWVAGMDAIEKSAFRYCQYDLFWFRDGMKFHLMEYLAACCIWPRNIEMLMKCGMDKLVSDLVLGVRKNARLFHWGEENPKKAFGLDGQEWRAFVESGYDLRALGIYKRLRSGGYRHSFPLAKSICQLVVDKNGAGWFFRTCKETGLEPARVMRWLGWSDSLCSRGITGVFVRFGQWRDYIRFCQRLGYDLKDETVSLPRDFMRRHDETAVEVARLDRIERDRREAERKKELAEKYQQFEKGLAQRAEKYDFALGDMFIRVARTFEEIVEEGNALKHCVGGYAGRHIEGKVTILFLRRTAEPDVPFVTVEMDGNRLVQAHGFRNDAGGRPPQEVYAAFFNTWLDWIGRGSPRDKNGAPKLRRKKGAHAA